ncbi:AAA family ATPase [Tessaracoccus lacteus]|uniref:AAA family ATPase n=1 Tax=Tessaracoccus lacteus TaxID=3041766 RepID=A0ABY8PXH9_9ACTN|nr:AAA family ATPase [Tessaracoccus sp. T21]WGT47220.1 AAA family ATPase [Tessaracoccus sp. T21]
MSEEMEPRRRAAVTWASCIEPEPVIWAWSEGDAGRIPSGSLSLAAGREGTGKSSFGIWMAAQITKGLLPGSFYGTPRPVFYVAVEDSWKYTLVPRLMAAGADLSKVGRFEVVSEIGDELSLSLPMDNSLLEDEVNRNGVALVVVDPLMSVIGSKIDTHKERDVRTALDPLAKLADRTGSVVLGIAHFNKGNGSDAASLITGSGAFKNVPRSVFGFARDEADENGGRVMSQVKNSLGRDDLPSLSYVIESAEIATKKGVATTGKFTFTGESERSVADVLRSTNSGFDGAEDQQDAGQWLVDYLAVNGAEAPAKDVFKAGRADGFSVDVLKRAKGRKVRSAKVGNAWVWQLSDEASDPKGAPREQESKGQKPAPLPPSPRSSALRLVPNPGDDETGSAS